MSIAEQLHQKIKDFYGEHQGEILEDGDLDDLVCGFMENLEYQIKVEKGEEQ